MKKKKVKTSFDIIYDSFVKSARAAGFTDDQINFMEQWFFDQLYWEDEKL